MVMPAYMGAQNKTENCVMKSVLNILHLINSPPPFI